MDNTAYLTPKKALEIISVYSTRMLIIEKRSLILADIHAPYQNHRALDIALSLGKEIDNLEEVIILGDLADFYNLSRFARDPSITTLLREEVAAVHTVLKHINILFPHQKKIYLGGNHEQRLQAYIVRNCPELFELQGLQIENLLQCKQFGFEYIAYGPNQQYKILGGDYIARHEPYAGGQSFCRGSVQRAQMNHVFGHHHQIARATSVNLNNRNNEAISIGCLCDKTNPVFGYVKNIHQWQLGFAIATMLGNGLTFIDNLHIKEREDKLFTLWDGHYYEN